MERKTKHRILGFAVIAAVIIILFPFIEKEKGLPPQTDHYVTPPPFPVPANAAAPVASQAPSISAADVTANEQQPDDTIAQPQTPIKPNTVSANTNNVIPIIPGSADQVSHIVHSSLAKASSPVAKATSLVIPRDDGVAGGERAVGGASVTNNVTFLPQAPKAPDAPVPTQVTNDAALQHDIESELFNIKSQIVSNTHKKIAEFTEVKSTAWVVQLGVFREKNNALRLVNQLRANGYRAFIASTGEITKVFVGPENKQNLAHSLASRLETEMHIRGIVVNYKPFTL